MLGQEKAFSIMEQILARRKADKMELVLMGHDHFLTRYANSQIHQNTAEENATLYIKAISGKKVGIATINQFDPESLARGVELALETAKRQEDIEDFVDLAQPADYEETGGYYSRTAQINAEEKALVIQDMISRTHGDRISLSGAFYTGQAEIAVMNSNGVKAYHKDTKANLAVVTSGKDTSGFATASSKNVDEIDHTVLIEEALESARKYPETKTLEPGEYPVILGEYAVGEILLYFSFMSFTSMAKDEGHSFAVKNAGKKIFPENVSIYDDGLDPLSMAMPFDYEGVPKKRLDFIKNGTVCGNYTYNTYAAHKAKTNATGHGSLPGYGMADSAPLHLFMQAGDTSNEDLMKKMGTGIYINKLHYLTTIHPLKTLLSGMTSHGVFWVENGEITARVTNMRFTQSIIEMLKNVKAIGKERKTIWFRDFSLDEPTSIVIPRLYVDKFNFTGKTEF